MPRRLQRFLRLAGGGLQRLLVRVPCRFLGAGSVVAWLVSTSRFGWTTFLRGPSLGLQPAGDHFVTAWEALLPDVAPQLTGYEGLTEESQPSKECSLQPRPCGVTAEGHETAPDLPPIHTTCRQRVGERSA